ncbi:MAG: gas vesicle protein [Leptolyngbya sp. SIO1D8]|nr:gas vesicle protein [Leptolyngbya sp. SIO1D8]
MRKCPQWDTRDLRDDGFLLYNQLSRSSTSSNRTITTATQGATLVDVLERVLDKGIVIAGDISVSVGSTELLSIRIRLLVASVDKAREIGINWWESDPHLSGKSQELLDANQKLQARIEGLENELRALKAANPDSNNA